MSSAPQGPTGAARRRTRISDAETERRMLDTAIQLIMDRGMTVSLEHLSVEEIIQAAGVARTSVYRRWPYKDLFFSDLLIELAKATQLGTGYGAIPALLAEHMVQLLPRPEGVDPEQDHKDVTVEVLRVATQADFDTIYASQQWRTHIALHATHLGLPDGDLRREIGRALRQSEQRFTALREAVFRRFAPLMGYRISGSFTDPDVGYAALALAAGSVMTGLVVRALADPDLVTDRRRLAPFGTSRETEWAAPAVVLVGVILSYVERDTDVEWGDACIRQAIDGMRSLAAADG
jgi:AcrR family transcriptional regulator